MRVPIRDLAKREGCTTWYWLNRAWQKAHGGKDHGTVVNDSNRCNADPSYFPIYAIQYVNGKPDNVLPLRAVPRR